MASVEPMLKLGFRENRPRSIQRRRHLLDNSCSVEQRRALVDAAACYMRSARQTERSGRSASRLRRGTPKHSLTTLAESALWVDSGGFLKALAN